jgi:hypothetical protein
VQCYLFNLTHVGFLLLFYTSSSRRFSFTHVRAPPKKWRFPQSQFANIVSYFGLTKYIVCRRLPPFHHHPVHPTRSLTSYASRVRPGKSPRHLQHICSLIQVPGGGRRSPLVMGPRWQTWTPTTTTTTIPMKTKKLSNMRWEQGEYSCILEARYPFWGAGDPWVPFAHPTPNMSQNRPTPIRVSPYPNHHHCPRCVSTTI